ncbi:MAG: hypothetical protein DI536_33405 [Archangium gephyra]|uniref:Uncharacterized protein n=1 Tax=Archangium gephyra TaxID=48 RepID=A0A2W5SZ20_9BACT|nr:MAG: hypothetical protein DI536_33405 [Archangium gephyra]
MNGLSRLGVSWSLYDASASFDDPVMCMGSPKLKKHGWSPGGFDLSHVSFEAQCAKWGAHLLNSGSAVTRVGDAEFLAERAFVRPVDDSKSFSGRVMTRDEFLALPKDALVQLAEPREILTASRFWSLRGEVVAHSVYARGG